MTKTAQSNAVDPLVLGAEPVSGEAAMEPAGAVIVLALKQLWIHHDHVSEDAMRALYHDTVEFRDPANVIAGIEPLISHTLKLYESLESCHFNYIDEVVSTDRATIRWVMTFLHPRLNGGNPVDVRGMTYIRWEGDKIVAHEDVFDIGAMFYENVPLLGRLIGGLRKRLSAGH